MITVKAPLFNLGRVLATPGAIEALEDAHQTAWELVSRHVRGDWGDVCEEDGELNDLAVKDGSRLLSAYSLKTGTKVWVITEADRSATTILLPDEY